MDAGFWTSQNALLGSQFAMDTVSNNIANINTVGFKQNVTNFQDLIYQTTSAGTASTNPIQIGLGAQIASNSLDLSQGSIQPSNVATNIAINGNGFFMVQNGPASSPNYYFTRAGNFSFDGANNLVDPNGNFVVGWTASPNSTGSGYTLPTNPQTGVPTGAAGPINISNYQKVPATASTYIKMQANLDSSSSVNEYSPATSNIGFNVLFDSNGNSLNVQPGNNFQISYDGGQTWHTYEYTPSNSTPQPNTEGFSTIGDLVGLMQTDINATNNTNATVSLNNGQITITNNSTNNNLNIMVRPTSQDPSFTGTASDNTKLDTVMEALNQIVLPGQSVNSQTLNTASHTVNAFFYDSTGAKHNLNITFNQINTNQWSYQATLPNNDGTLSNNSGVINFDANGGLDPSTTSPTINVSLNNGATNLNLLLNFWNTPNAAYSGNQFTGLTQFALPSNTTFLTQDGSPSGTLQSVNFDTQGNLIGSYSNGNSYTIAKVAIANFTNPQGLAQVGSNLYQITANTDTPQTIASKSYIGVAGLGSRGTISPSSLEQSNASIDQALTNMIIYERAFQANSKSIQTIDQILQTAISLKQ